jgi:[ribosomal protein S5]-alanine N-acetyltransferase
MRLLFRKSKNIFVRPLSRLDYSVWREFHVSRPEKKNKWDRQGNSLDRLTRKAFLMLLKEQKKMRDSEQFYDLAVFERNSGRIIGNVSAMNIIRSVSQTAFLGYSIHHSFWGKGYGKESVLMMIDIAFRDLKLHRIEAGIEPTNRRSIFLARSIGLRKEGLKKRAVFLRNQWVDLSIYSATCEEFGFRWKYKTEVRVR